MIGFTNDRRDRYDKIKAKCIKAFSVARENLEKTKSFWALRVMEIAATT